MIATFAISFAQGLVLGFAMLGIAVTTVWLAGRNGGQR